MAEVRRVISHVLDNLEIGSEADVFPELDTQGYLNLSGATNLSGAHLDVKLYAVQALLLQKCPGRIGVVRVILAEFRVCEWELASQPVRGVA